LPKFVEKTSVGIRLNCPDKRMLELAVMRIADIAIATGAGMKIPPLPLPDRLIKRKYRISLNIPFERFLVKLINPTKETVRCLQNLNLPLGIDIEIENDELGEP